MTQLDANSKLEQAILHFDEELAGKTANEIVKNNQVVDVIVRTLPQDLFEEAV